MYRAELPTRARDPQPPAAPRPLVIALLAASWLVFACGLPLHEVREARRQAHEELAKIAATHPLESAAIIEAFDRSTQRVDAAATGPCALLAVTVICLLRQLVRCKRRIESARVDTGANVHLDE